MVLSYSAAAQPTSSTPKTIPLVKKPASEALPIQAAASEAPTEATASTTSGTTTQPIPQGASRSIAETATEAEAGPSRPTRPRMKHLILDAGPLLSLTSLRGVAEFYHTTPAVLAELRDPKAREYWERLGLNGVDVKVEQPSGEAMARVMAFSKKTGDYAVLSQTDLGVIALTAQYELRENGDKNIRSSPPERKAAPQPQSNGDGVASTSPTNGSSQVESLERDVDEEMEEDGEDSDEGEEEAADEEGVDVADSGNEDTIGQDEVDQTGSGFQAEEKEVVPEAPTADDSTQQGTSQQDDAIFLTSLSLTPIQPSQDVSSSPVASTQPPEPDLDSESDAGEWITPSNVMHHRSRDLGLLPVGGKVQQEEIAAACMTGDYAVQNVLLGMGLGLVGEGGKRIGKVKSWVLRCHACFKDPSKKFCPSCGNPSLLRTSVTTTASGKQHINLKKNYHYQLRGSKFTIPDAKMGRAKGQQKGGTGLILREDQREWTDAVRSEDIRRGKEEKKILKGWDDPDWLPDIITVGMSGKGRNAGHGLPSIGHGRKNPNISRRKR